MKRTVPCGPSWKATENLLCKFVLVVKTGIRTPLSDIGARHDLIVDNSQSNNGFMKHFICNPSVYHISSTKKQRKRLYKRICKRLRNDEEIEQYSQKVSSKTEVKGPPGTFCLIFLSFYLC